MTTRGSRASAATVRQAQARAKRYEIMNKLYYAVVRALDRDPRLKPARVLALARFRNRLSKLSKEERRTVADNLEHYRQWAAARRDKATGKAVCFLAGRRTVGLCKGKVRRYVLGPFDSARPVAARNYCKRHVGWSNAVHLPADTPEQEAANRAAIIQGEVGPGAAEHIRQMLADKAATKAAGKAVCFHAAVSGWPCWPRDGRVRKYLVSRFQHHRSKLRIWRRWYCDRHAAPGSNETVLPADTPQQEAANRAAIVLAAQGAGGGNA